LVSIRLQENMSAHLAIGRPEILCLLDLYNLIISLAVYLLPLLNYVHSRRATCLRPLKHWGQGFESHPRHGSLCGFILCLCCPVCRYRPNDGLISVQGFLPSVYTITKPTKSANDQQRAVEPVMNELFQLN
jgi:hypothetical protein